MKRDLFEWFHKRVLARFSGRYLVDAGHLRVRVVSVWPHGRCGVVDAPDADADAVAVACDVGVSVEWRAEFTFPGSDGALGSVSGRVKVASARLLEDGRVETGEVEVLVGGEKIPRRTRARRREKRSRGGAREFRSRGGAREFRPRRRRPRRRRDNPGRVGRGCGDGRRPFGSRRRRELGGQSARASCATRARGASWRRWFEASPTR